MEIPKSWSEIGIFWWQNWTLTLSYIGWGYREGRCFWNERYYNYYNSFKLWLSLLPAFDRSEKYARQFGWFFPGLRLKIPKDKMPCESWNEVKCCWWKRSCTSWYVKYPIIYKVLYIPGGCLGFLNHQRYPLGWRESSSRCCPNLRSLGFLFKKRKATIRKFSNEGIRCMVICHIEMCIFKLYRKIVASNLSDMFMLNPPITLKGLTKNPP